MCELTDVVTGNAKCISMLVDVFFLLKDTVFANLFNICETVQGNIQIHYLCTIEHW